MSHETNQASLTTDDNEEVPDEESLAKGVSELLGSLERLQAMGQGEELQNNLAGFMRDALANPGTSHRNLKTAIFYLASKAQKTHNHAQMAGQTDKMLGSVVHHTGLFKSGLARTASRPDDNARLFGKWAGDLEPVLGAYRHASREMRHAEQTLNTTSDGLINTGARAEEDLSGMFDEPTYHAVAKEVCQTASSTADATEAAQTLTRDPAPSPIASDHGLKLAGDFADDTFQKIKAGGNAQQNNQFVGSVADNANRLRALT